MTIKNIGVGILGLCALLGLVSFMGFGLQHGEKALGSTGNGTETYYNSQWLVGGNQIGPTGTLNLNSQFGTCNLVGTNVTIAATSTQNYDCAVAGIKPGDLVLADPSANMGTGISANIYPIRAVASTTAGFVTFTFINLSGAASTTLGTNVASSTEYLSYR